MSCGPARAGDRIVLANGGTLSGRLRAVPFAKEAGHLALLAEREGGGRAVALVEAGAARIADGASIAGDALNAVSFDGVAAGGREGRAGRPRREALLLMGAAVRSVQMAGALEAILDLAVAYANERIAFERPIAKFQAVQHNLARLAGEVRRGGRRGGLGGRRDRDARPPLRFRLEGPTPALRSDGGGNPVQVS